MTGRVTALVELDARVQHRHRGERPFQRFGRCSCRGRVRDDQDRPLWITGRSWNALICLQCYCFALERRGKRAA
jgi:hypothetical protein